MKPSSISALLWLIAAVALGVGGFMVYDFKTNNDAIAAKAQEAWMTSDEWKENGKPVKSWESFRANAENTFSFPSDLRLVTGAPEVAAPKPEKKGPDGNKPVKPVVRKVNLKAEADQLRQEFNSQLVLQQVYVFQSLNADNKFAIDQQNSFAMFVAKYGPVDESARNSFNLRPGQRLVDNEMSYTAVGLEKPKDLPLILHDSRLVELTAHSAIFAVNSPSFRNKYKKAMEEDEAAAKKAVDEKGYVRVEVMQDKADEHANSLFSTDPTKIVKDIVLNGKAKDGPGPTMTGVAGVRNRELELIARETARREEERRKAAAKIPEKTIIDKDGNVEVGREDLHPDAFKGMEQYGETYIDPDTSKPAGVKISRSLDQSSANIIRRYGGLPGDIIKSINGVAVTDSQSIRGTVRKMRNDNVETFNVIYLRNGQEKTKVIKARKTDPKPTNK